MSIRHEGQPLSGAVLLGGRHGGAGFVPSLDQESAAQRRWARGELTNIRPPTGSLPGTWYGAPTASVLPPEHEGGNDQIVLLFRKRLSQQLSVEMSRGGEIAGVVSTDGGRTFPKKLFGVSKEEVDAISLERGALHHRADGRVDLYISRDIGDKCWEIDRLRSLNPEDPYAFNASTLEVIVPGIKGMRAVKDPFIVTDEKDPYKVRMGYVAHPLTGDPVIDAQEADQMWSESLISEDGGETWRNPTVIMTPDVERPDRWDWWGTRVVHLYPDGRAVYDGKAGPTENFHETEGYAKDDGSGRLVSISDAPAVWSPHGEGSPTGRGAARYYTEVTATIDGERKRIGFRETAIGGGINGIQRVVIEEEAA